MSGSPDHRRLNAVANVHSYEAGFNGRMAKYRVQMIEEYSSEISSESSVLEIGAGEGPITEYLSRRFSNVIAVEGADSYFERLQSRFQESSNVSLVHGLFEDCSFDSKKFPLIVAAGVLEHVREPVEFLRKAGEVLDEDGLFLLTVPNATSLHRRIGVAMGLIADVHELTEQDRMVGHYRYYDFQMLKNDIQESGLSLDCMTGLLLKPFQNSKMDELSDPYCDALFEVAKEQPEWGAEIFACVRKGFKK